MGEIFIDMLTNFVTTSSDYQVIQTCQKVPSFTSGMNYEALYFQHHQHHNLKIKVYYSRQPDQNQN